MKRGRLVVSWLLGAVLASGPAAAQQMFIFPQNGQSQTQQDNDRNACHMWAVNQTGYDPSLASTTPPPSQPASGGILRGGARGAARGGLIGAIAGDAGRGAAIGATAGGLMGGIRQSNRNRQQEQYNRNWQAQQDSLRADHRRAMTACLEGKGYTVG